MTQPSEFGGYSGSIQPEPHKLTAIEEARLQRRVDPANPGDSVEAAREREVTGADQPEYRGTP